MNVFGFSSNPVNSYMVQHTSHISVKRVVDHLVILRRRNQYGPQLGVVTKPGTSIYVLNRCLPFVSLRVKCEVVHRVVFTKARCTSKTQVKETSNLFLIEPYYRANLVYQVVRTSAEQSEAKRNIQKYGGLV